MSTEVEQKNEFVTDEDGYTKEVTPSGDVISWSKTIDPGNGLRASIFRGQTKREVDNKIVESVKQASRRIVEQEKALKLGEGLLTPDPEQALPEFKRRDLSADELYAIAHSLTNPAQAQEAQRKLLEAEFGAPIETVRKTLRRTVELDEQLAGKAAGEEFAAKHPEYVLCRENGQTLVKWLVKNKLAPTVKNMEIALANLKDVLILRDPDADTKKDSVVPPPANPAPRPATRPRSASTALDDRDTSVPRGGASNVPTSGPSLEQIEAMTADQFERWAANPSNAAYYEKLVKRASGR